MRVEDGEPGRWKRTLNQYVITGEFPDDFGDGGSRRRLNGPCDEVGPPSAIFTASLARLSSS